MLFPIHFPENVEKLLLTTLLISTFLNTQWSYFVFIVFLDWLDVTFEKKSYTQVK